MPSTGINNGTLLSVYVNGTKIANATSHSLSVNQGLRDATTKDSGGWQDNLPALRDWSIDFEGLQAEDEAFNFSDLFALIGSRTRVSVKFTTNVSSDKYYHGYAYLTSLSREAPMEDNDSWSGTFTGDGALTESTLT